MKPYSKKISFNGRNKDYAPWANSMIKAGFNMSIRDVADLLNVSDSWIAHTLLFEINFVVYSAKFAWENFHTKCQTFIRREDLSDWIAKVGVFEVQTETVDLYSYLDPKNRSVVLKQYHEDFDENFNNRGTIPIKTLQYIDKNYYSYGSAKLKNLSCIKRKEVPYRMIEPFDILNKDIYFLTGTREIVYREAFLHGDVRVKIGTKTIFVRSNRDTDDFKMPFVIPYNTTVKLRKKAWYWNQAFKK